MRRVMCLLLTLIMSVSLAVPFTTGAADVREEFIRTDKSTYEVGEMVEIQYEFDGSDTTRWICFYKESVSVGNMVYAMTAGALRASNTFAPITTLGMNGTDTSALTQSGTYIMKVMYIEGETTDVAAADFKSGDKSTMTYTFSIQGGEASVPSIAVTDTEIGKGGVLNVQFAGIVNTLYNRTLTVELRDGNDEVVKSRVLWNSIYYAGKSGELAISLSDVEPGAYTVHLVCSDPEYALGTNEVSVTVTEEVADTLASIFPDNLFSSAEICSQYFANADNPGNTYELIDGEYVMHVPLHPGNDYMYTWDAIPYSKFTVTFEFLLHIVDGSQYSDEMDFLFGLPAAGIPFHQATLAHQAGSFELRHYKHTGATFENYDLDTMFIDIYEDETWFEFTAEITPEDVSIYINGEWWATLEDTAGCIGENGYIGLRGGSTGGWEIKNLKVEPGTLEEQASGNVIPETPTKAPATATPDVEDEIVPENEDGNSLWLVVAVTVVVLAGGLAAFVILKKKK